jgi:hypothetical protein
MQSQRTAEQIQCVVPLLSEVFPIQPQHSLATNVEEIVIPPISLELTTR